MIIRSLFFLLALSQSIMALNLLSEAADYARTHPEYPPIENENVLNPLFDTFHKAHAPSLFTRSLEKIGLRKPLWSSARLANNLEMLIAQREKNGLQKVLTIITKPEDQFVIVGPLFGAFHSLVRILTHLKKQGIIDDELKIVKPGKYLIFNGNMFDGSPYGFETLSLIISLMLKNPKRVISLQGTHEKNRSWLNYSLKRELRRRAWFIPTLEDRLTTFFGTLPDALALTGKKPEGGIIQISNISDATIGALQPHVKAIIRAEDRLISYNVHPGLMLSELEHGATIWSNFSGQTLLYNKYYNFMYDAYSILTIGGSAQMGTQMYKSTLTLYNRNINRKEPFRRADIMNVITGQSLLDKTYPLIEPTDANTLTFGATMDLTRAHKYIGLNVKAGLSAATHRVNQKGGIHGKLLRIIIKDDQYRPVLSRRNIIEFMDTVNPIIICPVGSGTLAASLDLIKEKKIFVLFTNSGSSKFRNPELTYIINFRASYADEGRALTNYALKNLLAKDFAFFYQNDDHGKSALSGAQEALKKKGITNWTEASYQPNTLNVDEAVDAIRKANPDTIGLFSVTTATIEFLKKLGAEFLANKQLLAQSPLGDKGFKQFLAENGLKVTFAQVVPDPVRSTLPITTEYRDYISRMGLQPETYSLESYIYGRLAAVFFSKIEGPITMEALANVIENIKDFPYKGLTLDFNPDNRQLSHILWIEPPEGPWIEQDLTKSTK